MNEAPSVTGISMQAGDTWKTEDGRQMIAVSMPEGIVGMEMIREIPVGLIDPHPANRDEFDDEKKSDMEDSLRSKGQLMPGIVRPKPGGRFELIAGERRWNGCVTVGIANFRTMVRDYSDAQALETLIWENLERENLSELQEAKLYQSLMEMKDGDGRNLYTLETIAERRFGDRKKLSRVARIMKLNGLPGCMKKALKEGQIAAGLAFLVARIADPEDREQAAKEVMKNPYGSGPMTKEQAQRHISDQYQVNLKGAKFDLEDASILDGEMKAKLGFTGADGEKGIPLGQEWPAIHKAVELRTAHRKLVAIRRPSARPGGDSGN